MGLEELKREVLAQAEKQAKAIIENTLREEEKILQESRSKAQSLVSQARSEGGKQAKELSLELKASALLQARRVESEAKEEVVQRVLAELKNKLAQTARSPRYEKIFASLARQAIRALGEKDFVLKTSPRDRKFGEKYGKVAGTVDAIGGVVVAKADGSIRINNTFEALLEENQEKLKQRVFGELFGREEREKKTAAGVVQAEKQLEEKKKPAKQPSGKKAKTKKTAPRQKKKKAKAGG